MRGASLGLPADGPGSLASFGTRVIAFLVDADGRGLHDRLTQTAVVRD